MTTRIAVSLRWEDSSDAVSAEAVARHVDADRNACLQGPGPALVDVLDAADDDRVELVGWSCDDGPVLASSRRRPVGPCP